jgi:hypothetical protein
LYLPDHGVSIAAMVNRFEDDCAFPIARDIARVAAREVGSPVATAE